MSSRKDEALVVLQAQRNVSQTTEHRSSTITQLRLSPAQPTSIATGVFSLRFVTKAIRSYSYSFFSQLLTGIRLEKYIEKTKTAVKGRHGSPLHATSASDSPDGLQLVTPKLFGSNPETQTDFPPVYVSLLERCFEFHAEDRLSASELENGVKMLISITT